MRERATLAGIAGKGALRRASALVALVACGALAVGLHARSAHADTFSMAAGMQTESGPLCYSFSVLDGSLGVYKSVENSDCFVQSFVMPLYWRNFYSASTSRTVQVRGRAHNSNVWMGCSLMVYNSNGLLVSQDTKSFPVSASYTSISLTVNNVLSSSTSFVRCQEAGSEPGRLVKVDYSP